ncbi:hypothetical protein HAX54_020927 [Datura stramonium]|uniref:Uncharacterized protein n=1 Tax=Datura stramonium TaxID=4076 RepID=A0ABS8UUP2_DATST|nr:hypothetical protein [Datura stramonium]
MMDSTLKVLSQTAGVRVAWPIVAILVRIAQLAALPTLRIPKLGAVEVLRDANLPLAVTLVLFESGLATLALLSPK